jgi:hypothetical protein
MKRRYILLTIVLFYAGFCQCQETVLSSELYPELRYSALRGQLFYSAYRQIKGNAYITEDWCIGTIYLKDGEVIREVQLKFDIYGHRLLVYQDYLKRVVIPEKTEIESFSFIENGKTRNFKSVNTDLTSQKLLTQYFLEVLNEGTVSFYKLYLCNVLPLKTPDMPYIDEFILQRDYYLFYNGQYETARTKRSYLLNKFPQYKTELKKFIRENKLKPKREADFAVVIGHLGDLMDKSNK